MLNNTEEQVKAMRESPVNKAVLHSGGTSHKNPAEASQIQFNSVAQV